MPSLVQIVRELSAVFKAGGLSTVVPDPLTDALLVYDSSGELAGQVVADDLLNAGRSGFEIVGIDNTDSPYAVLATDTTILCDCTSGAITVDLPAAAANQRRVLYIKKIDSSVNAVTIDGNASETIDGATTQVISSQHEVITMQSDGTEWWIL